MQRYFQVLLENCSVILYDKPPKEFSTQYWNSNQNFPIHWSQLQHFENGYGEGFCSPKDYISYVQNFCTKLRPHFLRGEKESDKVLELCLEKFLDRPKMLGSTFSSTHLKQADLLGVYLEAFAANELPPVYEPTISRQVLKAYKEIEAIRNTEPEFITNRRHLESTIYELCKTGYSFWTMRSDHKLEEFCEKNYRTYYIERNAELEKYEPAIQVAHNIFKQFCSHFQDTVNEQHRLLFSLMRVGISRALGFQSAEQEDSTLTKTIFVIAIARYFYDRKLPDFCYSDLYDFRTFDEWLIEELSDIHGFLSHEPFFSHVTENRQIERAVDEILKASRLSAAARTSLFSKLLDQICDFSSKQGDYSKSSETFIFYSSLTNFSGLVAEYRRLTDIGNYPVGDERILLEARRRTEIEKGHAEELALTPFSSSITRIIYPWETHTFKLNCVGRVGRIVSLEMETLNSKELHPMFWSLKNHAFDKISALGFSMVREIFLSDKTIADGSCQLIPSLSGKLMPSSHESEQRLSFKPGHLYKMEAWHQMGGGYIEHYFFVPDISFLFTIIRKSYHQGMSYRMRFRNFLTGSLTFQQGSFIQTQAFINKSWTDFTPQNVGAGTLKISIENHPEHTIKKDILIKPETRAQALKKAMSELDESYMKNSCLRSEIENKDTIFYVLNEKFAKIDYKGKLKLWKEPEKYCKSNPDVEGTVSSSTTKTSESSGASGTSETSGASSKTLDPRYQRYLNGYSKTKKFLCDGYSKDRLAKAILSSLCLLSNDLTFAPLFTLGCCLYESNSAQTIDRYLDLLAKHIALYELMQGAEQEHPMTALEMAAFIETHSTEFPDYWAFIFKETHSVTDLTFKAFHLFIIQSFLTVFKGEAITINTDTLFQFAEFLFGLKDEQNYKRLLAAIEESFKDVPGYWEWQAAIHEKWGGDFDSWEDFLTELQEARVSEQEHFGVNQINIASLYGRARSENFDAATQVIYHCLLEAYERQAELEATQIFFSEKRDEAEQQLQAIRKVIADYLEQLRNHQEAIENAKRHARKQKRRAIIRMAVGLAIGAFLAPVLAQAVAAGLAQMSTSLVALQASIGKFLTPIISSAISTGIQRGNIPKAVLFSFANGLLCKAFNAVPPIESDLIRESVAMGAASAVTALARGVKFSAALGEGIGAGVANYCFAPPESSQSSHSSQIGRVLSSTEISLNISKELGRMMIRPVFQSAISDAVQRQRINIDLLGAACGVVQGAAGMLGNTVHQRMQDKENHTSRDFEDKNSKSIASTQPKGRTSAAEKEKAQEKAQLEKFSKKHQREKSFQGNSKNLDHEEASIVKLTHDKKRTSASNGKNKLPSSEFFENPQDRTFLPGLTDTADAPSEINARDFSPIAHIEAAGTGTQSKHSEPKKANKVAFAAGSVLGLGARAAVNTVDTVIGTFNLLHSSAELIDNPKYLAEVERERAKQIQAIKKDPAGVGKAIVNGIKQKVTDYRAKVENSYAAGEGLLSGLIFGDGIGEVASYCVAGAGLVRAGVKVAQQTAMGARNVIAAASSADSFMNAGRAAGRAVTSRQGLMLSGTLATGGSLMFASPNAQASSDSSQTHGLSPAAVAVGAGAFGLTAYGMARGKIPPFERLTGNEIKKLFAELKKPPNTSQAPMGLASAGAPHVPETAFARGKRPADMPKVESQPLMLYRKETKEHSLQINNRSGNIHQSQMSKTTLIDTPKQVVAEKHRYFSPPRDKFLIGFPEAKHIKGKNPRQGGGKPRDRWRLLDGRILEWDYMHGRVEMWNKQMTRHLGEFDSETGKMLKSADRSKNIDRKFR